ncbi:MAG: TonB-dependent receptor [Caulobacterales bacterium]|jgi:outer membrane receptor protein involved in Fe transport|nr:TonB-dependent receptor [Caulobacterales bacterium]
MSKEKGALKGLLAFSGSVLALVTATPSHAQTAEEEIIVTATRRAQDIQDVPIAVTALNESQLQNAGVVDIRALQTISPSINLNSTQTESGGTTMRIRGVGTTGNNAGLESAVGVFIDGVYISRPSIALGELLDIQQVEILRGPQGTLFGRNTSAGALTITTRAPDLSEFGAFGNMTVGSIADGDDIGLMSAQVGVNIPIVTDQLGIRIAAAGRVRDGLLTSTFDGADQNTRDRYMVRAQALWQASPDLSFRFVADHQEGQDECCDAVLLYESPFVAAYPMAGLPVGGGAPASGWDAFENRQSNAEGFSDPGEQTGYTLEANWDSSIGTLTYIGSFRESEAGPNVQESDFVGLNVFSVGGSTASGDNPNAATTEYTSHELRLAGEVGRLNWLVGYYYGREDIDVTAELTLGTQFQANTNANILAILSATAAGAGENLNVALATAFGGGANALAFIGNPSSVLSLGFNPSGAFARNHFTQEGESTSFFTHNTLAVTDRLDLTIGARYVEETKDGAFDQLAVSNNACLGALGVAQLGAPVTAGTFNAPIGNAIAAISGSHPATSAALANAVLINAGYTCFPFAAPAPIAPEFSDTFEDEELVYTANLSYAFTDDIRGYASFTHGFKSGGFNLDPTAAFSGADPRFNSELVDAYELGLKTELFNDRLRANFALFRSEIEDFQVLEFTGVQFVTFNVPHVIAEGAEVELFGRLSENLGASFAVTYTDARYPEDCAEGLSPTVVAVTSLCGSTLTNAPEWVSVLGFDYDHDFASNLRFFLSGSVRYESERRTSTQSHVVPSSGTLVRQILSTEDIQEANTKVNLRLGIGGQDERWALELWGTNIFDEQTRNVTFNIPLRGVAQYAARGAFLEEPAIYGLTLRMNY